MQSFQTIRWPSAQGTSADNLVRAQRRLRQTMTVLRLTVLRLTVLRLTVLGLLVLSTSLLQAQDKPLKKGTRAVEAQESDEKIPPARPKYMGRRIAQTMSFHGASWLIRDEREQEERPSQVLPQLGLKAGMTVCDMGCGNGFYSIAMAKIVVPGKVLAVDIQQEMLHLLKLRADDAGVENIRPLLGTAVNPQLPAASVDLVLMVDVYHEFSHPQQMLSAIRTSLKPGGRIALLEYREEDPLVPIKPEHKMSKRQILKEYSANGLRLVQQVDDLPWQHLMFFEADPDWKVAASSDSE